jgi:hypothetical protein
MMRLPRGGITRRKALLRRLLHGIDLFDRLRVAESLVRQWLGLRDLALCVRPLLVFLTLSLF